MKSPSARTTETNWKLLKAHKLKKSRIDNLMTINSLVGKGSFVCPGKGWVIHVAIAKASLIIFFFEINYWFSYALLTLP